MKNVEQEIESMLKKGENSRRPINGHVGNDDFTAYIRVTKRYIDGMRSTIDIGNVEVLEDVQQKGIFKEFLKIIERLAEKYGRMVYIESVLNELLLDKLPEYGYTMVPNSVPPSFYKEFK